MKGQSKDNEHLSLIKSQIPNANEEASQNNTNEIIPQEVIAGSIVTFTLLEHETNESETYTFKLVDHPKSSDSELSLDSTTGKKIHKAHVGDVVTYTLMSNTFTATILDIQISS